MSEPVLNAVLRLYCAAQMSIMLARKLAPPPPIAAALAGFGRSGVPVYVLYPPGGEPRLLPEILTREGVIDALADFPRRKESS